MLAVIMENLDGNEENTVLLFESAKQMSLYIQCEHSLTPDERREIEEKRYACLYTKEDGTYYLVKASVELTAPHGSVAYSLACCNDQREWEVC